MHSTFTGSSRRTRNVNLSGQNQNPFANVWSPATSSGASKTVSNAQAERQQRQQERDRLKAAYNIQKTWRSHRVRRRCRNTWRRNFDDIYRGDTQNNARQRVHAALPLLLAVFQANRPDDVQRLVLVTQDIISGDVDSLLPEIDGDYKQMQEEHRLRRLSEVTVAGLEQMYDEGKNQHQTKLLVDSLAYLASGQPRALLHVLPRYFGLLAKLLSTSDSDHQSEKILTLVLAPLNTHPSAGTSDQDASYTNRAYDAFAFNFLAAGHIAILEQKNSLLAQRISIDVLSATIIEAYTGPRAASASPDGLLWLLAHFIDIHQTQKSTSHRLGPLRALHVQLSSLASQIRFRLPLKADEASSGTDRPGRDTDSVLRPLPPYVSAQLISCVDRAGITDILSELASTFASETNENHTMTNSNKNFDGASLLAGYIITLLRCFPSYGDEIRMRLFLGDIPSAEGNMPVIKYLWQTTSQTSLFGRVSNDRGSIHAAGSIPHLVKRYLSKSGTGEDSAIEEQEWRLTLLFLELYTFILRLSDDDDFFSGIWPKIIGDGQPVTRLRACSLSLNDIKGLTVFLKNLGFALHYYSNEILQDLAPSFATANGMDLFSGTGSAHKSSKERRTSADEKASSFDKPDLASLRIVVTSTLRMLYERDSRRPFLPGDHWLMTSNFDMDKFASMVVVEHQRQQEELANLSDDDEEDEEEDIDEDVEMHDGVHTFAGQRLSQHAQIENLRARQRRAQKARMLSVIGPKLEILRHMPFVIPFDTRVQIFRHFIHLDQLKRRQGMDAEQWRMSMVNNPLMPDRGLAGRHRGRITRGHEFDDAFTQFFELGEGLKETVQIQFIDQFGEVEAGIDGGGVAKEFLLSAINQIFCVQTNDRFFVENKQKLWYPNPTLYDRVKVEMEDAHFSQAKQKEEMEDLMQQFEFLGRLVGKCMYEDILIDVTFAGFFLLKWASNLTGEESYRGNVNDLRDLDEDLYQGLVRLKNYPADEVESLGVDFTVEDQTSGEGEPFRSISRELIPGRGTTPVTKDNRLLYISYMARHRLVVQPAHQTLAFLRGLRSIIAPTWLSMFNQMELQRLVGGDSSEISIDDLRNNTVYSGLYVIGDDGREHPTIKLFWKVVREFTDAQRRDLLKYVTSTPRAPLLGFSSLNPMFSIRDGGVDEARLPSASTCVNLLKLPRYTDEDTLRKKLVLAISAGAGFDLS